MLRYSLLNHGKDIALPAVGDIERWKMAKLRKMAVYREFYPSMLIES